MSENTLRVLRVGLQSKAVYISWANDINWFRRESLK